MSAVCPSPIQLMGTSISISFEMRASWRRADISVTSSGTSPPALFALILETQMANKPSVSSAPSSLACAVACANVWRTALPSLFAKLFISMNSFLKTNPKNRGNRLLFILLPFAYNECLMVRKSVIVFQIMQLYSQRPSDSVMHPSASHWLVINLFQPHLRKSKIEYAT
jgi:hypothetical protein